MSKPARNSIPPVPLAEAKERLLPLVDELLSFRTDRVPLSRPGTQRQVLLVRASDIERLEAELAELRKRVEPEPRPLRGTATVIGDVEGMLAESRREANERYEAKMADILSDPASGASDAQVYDADSAPRDPLAIRGLVRRVAP